MQVYWQENRIDTVRVSHAILLAGCSVTSRAMHQVLRRSVAVQPASPLLLVCERNHLQHGDVWHPQPRVLKSLELEAEESGDKVRSK